MAHQGLLLGRSALQMRDFQVLEGSSERLQLHAGQVYSVVREVVVRQATKMSTGSSKALGCRTGPLSTEMSDPRRYIQGSGGASQKFHFLKIQREFSSWRTGISGFPTHSIALSTMSAGEARQKSVR